MDIQESWSKTFHWRFENHGLQDCSFVIHSDGGTRCGRSSGLAYVIEAGVLEANEWTFKPIVLSGT